MPRANLINCDFLCWLIFLTHSPFISGLNHVSNKLAFQIYYQQHGYIHQSIKSCFPSTEKKKIYLSNLLLRASLERTLEWKKTNLKERETTHDWDESASQYYLYH
jgi:hypothetical protein